jgi:Domain of unknown function (DUF4383)
MSNKAFTRGLGIIYLILGICGFTPSLVQTATPVGEPQTMFHYGYLFNGFPMNYVLAGLFVAIGLTALAVSTQIRRTRLFERSMFTLAMVLMVCGFVPGLSNMWGLMPLFGFTDGLFLATAMFTFYFAFVEGPLMPGVNAPIHSWPWHWHWPQ